MTLLAWQVLSSSDPAEPKGGRETLDPALAVEEPRPEALAELDASITRDVAEDQNEPSDAATLRPSPDSIQGIVVDERGSPMPGVSVRLFRMEQLARLGFADRALHRAQSAIHASALTASDGTFAFADLPSLAFSLEAEWGSAKEHRLDVPLGEYLRIVMGAGAQILGRIRCTSHDVEHTWQGTVALRRAGGKWDHFVQTPGPTGDFRFSGLEPGEYTMSGELEGHVVSNGPVAYVSSRHPEATVEMEASAAHTLTGWIKNEAGDPVADALVSADFLFRNRTVASNAQGKFELNALPAATDLPISVARFVFVRKEGYAPLTVQLEGAALKANEELHLILERGIFVSGRVVRADGAPVASAAVTARLYYQASEMASGIQCAETLTGVDGRFQLTWDANRELLVEVLRDGGAGVRLEARSSDTDHDLGDLVLPDAIPHTTTLCLRSGEPLVGWTLSVSGNRVRSLSPEPPGSSGRSDFLNRIAEVRTDAWGRATWSHFGPEDVRISVAPPGTAGQWHFELSADELRSGVSRIVLEDVLLVRGTLADLQGNPFAGQELTVRASPSEGEDLGAVITEPDGSFMLTARAAAETVAILHAYAGPTAIGEHLFADQPTHRELSLRSPNLVRSMVIVLQQDGSPAAGARLVALLPILGESVIGTTGPDGKLEVQVPEGSSYGVFAMTAAGGTTSIEPLPAGTAGLILRAQ